MKIKKNDQVVMLSGKDKGKTGKVIKVLLAHRGLGEGGVDNNRVVIEGLNMLKRAIRARKQGQKGQIISKERSVNVASVALVCKSCGKPTRVGYKLLENAQKVRTCKKCGAEV